MPFHYFRAQKQILSRQQFQIRGDAKQREQNFQNFLQIIYKLRLFVKLQQFSYRIIMSRRANSQSRQVETYDRHDPFKQMHQIMKGFGGFGNDSLFGEMMGFGGRDPFEDMFKFSDVHKNMHSKGAQGSYVCQSFVSSSKMGPDGKIVREDYFENSMGEHKGGNTISQKQQAYKNSSGVNRIAEERMLNDRGRKIIKQKNGSQVEETNHYYNIDEEQSSKFDTDWRQANKDMKFLENHQRYLQQLGSEQPKHRQIGYEPRQQREQRAGNQNQRQQKNKRSSQISSKPSDSAYSGSRGTKRSQPITQAPRRY